VQVIDQNTLEVSRVLTVNEALRKVPGATRRRREGLGLRPNLGLRGVNPDAIDQDPAAGGWDTAGIRALW
jgi:outer membrane receptor for Fe3+-dicitrate